MCEICKGVLWVCENHPDKPWDDSIEGGCECNAGMPCGCNPMGALPPGSVLTYGKDISYLSTKTQ